MTMDKRKLRKFISKLQQQGVIFHRTLRFFVTELPDALLGNRELETTIKQNANLIFEVLWPEPRASRSKRRTCEICKSGTGCRQRQSARAPRTCAACGHDCFCHIREVKDPAGVIWITAGCQRPMWVPPSTEYTRCTCTGFMERWQADTQSKDCSPCAERAQPDLLRGELP